MTGVQTCALPIFIQQLPYVLPCKKCGINLLRNLHNLDDALESKHKLCAWFINIRNDIDIDNNNFHNIDITYSINELFNINNHLSSSICYIIISFLIIIILFLLYNDKKKWKNEKAKKKMKKMKKMKKKGKMIII